MSEICTHIRHEDCNATCGCTGPGSALHPPQPRFDPVNKPKHYNLGGIECIDAIAAATTGLEGIEAVDTGQVIKYIWRWKHKALPVEDLKKCRWYLDHLIKHVEKQAVPEVVTQPRRVFTKAEEDRLVELSQLEYANRLRPLQEKELSELRVKLAITNTPSST